MSNANSTTNYTIGNYTCRGGVYNCVSDTPVDSDIAGIGVIISFLATAIFTFVVILVGYFTYSLPGVQTNQVDDLIITLVRRLLFQKPVPQLGIISEPEKSELAEKIKRNQEAFENFILTLSDQQLVTGLAITIVGYERCDTSLYSIGIVMALAWFSCTTHLSTITVLKRYLNNHKIVQYLRVALMVAVALLVAPLIVINHVIIRASSYPGTATYCVLNRQLSNYDLSQAILNSFPALAWLITAYINRLAGLFLDVDTSSSRSWIYQKIMLYMKQSIPDDREAIIRAIHANNARSIAARNPRIVLLCFQYIYIDMTTSFAWEIMWLSFGFVLGINTLILNWKWSTPNFNPSSVFNFGFGQQVSILLLILPFLSGLEAWTEVRRSTIDSATLDSSLTNTNATIPSISLSINASDTTEQQEQNPQSLITDTSISDELRNDPSLSLVPTTISSSSSRMGSEIRLIESNSASSLNPTVTPIETSNNVLSDHEQTETLRQGTYSTGIASEIFVPASVPRTPTMEMEEGLRRRQTGLGTADSPTGFQAQLPSTTEPQGMFPHFLSVGLQERNNDFYAVGTLRLLLAFLLLHFYGFLLVTAFDVSKNKLFSSSVKNYWSGINIFLPYLIFSLIDLKDIISVLYRRGRSGPN